MQFRTMVLLPLLVLSALPVFAQNEVSLREIIQEVDERGISNFSPPGSDFRPKRDLKEKIESYVKAQDPRHLAELRTELNQTKNPLSAIACIYMVSCFDRNESISILQQYQRELTGDRLSNYD